MNNLYLNLSLWMIVKHGKRRTLCSFLFNQGSAKESIESPRWLHFGAGNIFKMFPARSR